MVWLKIKAQSSVTFILLLTVGELTVVNYVSESQRATMELGHILSFIDVSWFVTCPCRYVHFFDLEIEPNQYNTAQ